MKRHFRGVLRRFGTFFLSLVLAISSVPAFPIEAFAATSLQIGIDGLSAEFDGGSWEFKNGAITGQVKTGETSGCTGPTYTPQTGTLTFKNTSESTAILSYSTAKEGKGSVADSGNGQVKLESGGSTTIKITSASDASDTTTVKIANIRFIPARVVTTAFFTPMNGSFTVDGTTVTEDMQLSKSSDEPYQLVATPAAGFKFFRWYRADSGETISTESTVAYYSTEEQSIAAEFVDENSAVFEVGASLFTDLNDAVLYAQQANESKITLVSDGILPAGNYTIPSGKTLLIPFNDDRTLYTTTPDVTYNQYATPSPYKTLTMAEGASITVADGGAISLGSKLSAKGQLGGWNGTPTGPDGRIKMDAGSTITVNDGGALYAYGYITGSGSVLAKSGSTVYECFQIKDWRGGTATSNIYEYAFILSQYYVQNIEVPLTLEAGATEHGYSAVNASSRAYAMEASFIGDNGLFNMTEGSVTKRYDSASDRLIIDLDGTAQINSMLMSGLPIIGSISTQNFDLPINSNITINCLSGTNITVNQNIKMLPGAEFNIAQGASATVASGTKVYAYDNDDWNNYTGSARLYVIGYSASNGTKAKRTAASLTDAKINVDGALTVNGELYTSTGGAYITSTGTGSVTFKQAAPTADVSIYEMENNSLQAEVAMKPAQLHNGDGTYTETAGSPAGTKFYYCTTCSPNGVWEKEHAAAPVNVKFYANAPVGTTATGSMDTQQIASGVKTALSENQFAIEHYDFTGWNTEADGTGTPYTDKQEVALTEDTTLYAQWEKDAYTVTWKNANGTVLETDENVAYGATPSYDGETPTKQSDAQYTYTFSGWTPEVTTVSGDATYTATYAQTANEYTIKFVNYDGTQLQSTKVAYGETPAYTGETPTKVSTSEFTYMFKGWTPEITSVTGDATYTATYTEAKNSYTITWKNDDGSVIDTTTVEYGTVPSYGGEIPTKPGDAQYTYTFAGWTPEPVAVTGDAEYTATFKTETNKYTIKFVNDDGTELQSSEVAYGETPAYTGETPAKAGDAQFNYVFLGWSPTIEPVAGDATYTAQYTSRTYTVTWNNFDGSTLETDENVEYGTKPSYDGETPVKPGDAQYTYTFAGWSPEVAEVTGNATYTATFTESVNKYTIKFVNEDGTELQSSEVEYGEMPEYKGETPAKPSTDEFTYTFAAWDKPLVTVTGEATYKATYTPSTNKYEVKFVDEDGKTELQKETLDYGTAIKYKGEEPTKAADAQYTYTFAGWIDVATGEVVDFDDEQHPVTVTGPTTFVAYYEATVNKYNVTFKNEGGTVLQSSEVEYGKMPVYEGETPTKEATGEFSYEFAGWSPAISEVTGDATYIATFKEVKQAYTIVFVNANGEQLQTSDVEYGETPAYTGETPTKAADAQYTYSFTGWTPKIARVTGNATYTATFSETVNEYTITFKNEDGTELQSSKVPYGKVPAYTGEIPAKADDEQYTYTFVGWSNGAAMLPNLPEVTGDATYTAAFTSELKSYQITFEANGGDGTMEPQALGYGVEGTLNANSFAKQGSAFNGWNTKADGSGTSYEDKASITITSDVTLYAQWMLDGWQTAKNGDLTYYVKGELQKSGWTEIDGKTYHLDSETGIAAAGGIYWLERPDEGYAASQWDIDNNDDYETLGYLKNSYFVFGDDGEFQSSTSGMYDVSADTKVVGGNASSPSGELVVWADRGEIPWHAGLVTWQGYHYYFTTGAFEAGKSYVTNTNYYVSKPNEIAWPEKWGDGTFGRGKYTFDASGHMLLRDGFENADVDTLYYVKGALVYAGLIDVDGDYYYVKSDGKLVKGRDYYVSKTNDLVAAGTYTFDADGKMVRPEELQQGLVWKDGELYYYVDGEPSYAGLVQVGGYYYYFPGSKVAVRSQAYTITKTNGLKPQARYTFDSEGKMVVLDGIVRDGDTWKYYVDGAKTYAGLIEIGGARYYVKSDGTVVHGQDYTITKTNGLKAAGKYTFDAEGKMVVLDGIVRDGDIWTYYVDGAKTYAGLIEIGGARYYVKSDCTVVHGRDYYVSKNNGIVPSGTYTFDAEGKMQQ